MPSARKSALLCAAALTLSAACSGNFDTTRVRTEPVATLGDEIYTVLCDRVGASVLTEDLTGGSYHRVCHRSPTGKYSDTVDESRLPPDDSKARTLAIAKLHAMARRRGELIQALNAAFKKEQLPVPYGKPGETISSHTALSIFLKRLVPLYETNPVDTQGSGATEALMPSVTRATGRLFAALAGPDKDNPHTAFADQKVAEAAQAALAGFSGRQGYRPTRVLLGALRPAMTYPELRSLTQTFAPRLGPGGPMRDAFQNVLGMTQSELETSLSKDPPVALTVDVSRMQPNRPRTNTEIAQAIMLATNPAFAAPGAEPRLLVKRDLRGYALPNNWPASAIFSDADGDGFADVDQFGRFVTALPINTPFFAPTIPEVAQRDPLGRAVDGSGQPLYTYLNTSEALVASLSRDLEPLLDPDPAAQHETLADLLAGAFMLYGDPIQAPAQWASGGIYSTFDTQNSPIVELLHATGWMLAHKNSDLHLKLVRKLFAEHPQLMARVIGAALRIRDIANQYPEIALDPSVTIWDEMGEFTAKLTKNPPLFRDLLRSLAHPDVQAYIGSAYSKYNQFRDELHYDTNNVNGPPVNETAGGTLDPQTPVDPTKPDAGAERSEFHRILQIIHDVNDVNACNKADAKVRLKAVGLPITYPFGSGYKECELFVFKNMGVFYLHSILGKAKLDIRPDFLNTLMSVAGIFTDPNKMMEESAEIVGMTLSPTPPALNRLVYFGAESPKFDPLFGGKMPDRDPNWNGKNDTTNKFISRIVDPVSSAACPERAVVDPNGTLGTLWLADCNPSLSWKHNPALKGDVKDLMRIRNHGTIFTWEKFEFYKAMRPLLKAFDDHGQAELFLEQIEILYRHWATPKHAPEECNKSGDFSKRPWQKYLSEQDKVTHNVNPAYNPKYCNESGVSRYEPILAQAFVTDFLPALGELVKLLDNPSFVTHDRAGGTPVSGLDVLLETTSALFDPGYASSVGMMDRKGSKQAKWANGLIDKPITLFDMFANAMASIDQVHASDPARRDRWRRARSQLVDQFLAVDGEGPSAKFRNPAFIASIPVLVDVLREQLNANCPDRETSPMACSWATKELSSKAADTLGGPAFSTVMHLIELINQDGEARYALQAHLKYLLEQASGDDDVLHSTLTSMSDMMQIIGDDQKMPLIYNAIAVAAAPESAKLGNQAAPGAADRVLELMHAITAESGKPNPYDPYRVMDRILANLFTPLDPADPNSQTPIEIFLDTIAEVNRHDSDLPREQPLGAADFRFIFATMRDFMTHETRGMEQFYEIVRHRDGN
jgi:phosphopantetheinyl transferase (holo-ACP synthase)